ncbi:MAG: SusF/SusE family outer membrane protein [Prevotella sp.]|nr:SusF/SusE family outer membrane protein [Prevotella sp.]
MRKILLTFAILLSLVTANGQDISKVYMIGGATPAGWDLSRAVGMLSVSGKEGVFIWEGHLKKDEFKFVSNTNWYWPGFVATAANQKVETGMTYDLRYYEDGQDAYANDNKFVPTAEGDYKITVDLKALKMKVEKGVPQTIPGELWMEGSAVPGGILKLADGINGMFSYKGRLNKGTLCLMTTATAGDGTSYYVPLWECPDVQDGSPLVKTSDAGAEGFYVEVPSDYYRIDINLLSLNMTAAPFRAPYSIYIVGGAAESGWNTQDAVAFTQDIDNPYLYICRTELKKRTENVEPNLFKILGQLDWGPYSLHPAVSGQSITEAERFVENGDDTKWCVPDDKQGDYKISVDLWNGTIKGDFLNGVSGAKRDPNSTTGIVSVENMDGAFCVKTNGGSVIIGSTEILRNARLVSLSGNLVAMSGQSGNRIELGGCLAPGVYVVSADITGGQTCVQKVAVR